MLETNRRKKSGQNIEETSRYVRPEWVNNWLSSMVARYDIFINCNWVVTRWQ